MSKGKKLTAVEWLVNHFDEYGIDYGFFEPIINQAKEMEKQHIIESFRDGWMSDDSSEQYYEETYKKD